VRHRSDVSKRRSEREDHVAFLELIAVAPACGDQLVGFDLHDGEVTLGIRTEHFCLLDLPSIPERDDHRVGAAGDMVVGEDVAFAVGGFHDHAATAGDLIE